MTPSSRPAPGPLAEPLPDLPNDDLPLDRVRERRRAHRREGPFVLVDLLGPGGACGQAFVLDRSRTGLRLSVARPVETGTVLRLRARHVPEDAPWAEVAVRWAQPAGGGWELGCQFLGDLLWYAHMLID